MRLLEEKGIEIDIVRYLETPPTAAELRRICELLGLEPRQLLRRGEPEYRDLGLADPDLTSDQILAAIAEHPRLLERPIIVAPGGARIGRPPERLLEVI